MSDTFSIRITRRYDVTMTPEGAMLLAAGAFDQGDVAAEVANDEEFEDDSIFYVADDRPDGTCNCYVTASRYLESYAENTTLIATYSLPVDLFKIVT